MKKFFVYLVVLVGVMNPFGLVHASVAENVRGKILLQVEQAGEAWYVHPKTLERDYLGLPEDAYKIMRERGVGITTENLDKIPIGFFEMNDTDTDGDGLVDAFEQAIGSGFLTVDTDGDGFDDKTEVLNGYNPNGSGQAIFDTAFADQHVGKIFLQVELRGEAWWVNPADGKRYYLGSAEDAYSVMRHFGLGVSDEDLRTIRVSDLTIFTEPYPEARDTIRISNVRLVQIGLELFYADQGHYPRVEREVVLGSVYDRTQALAQFGWANRTDIVESDIVYVSRIYNDPLCEIDATRCDDPYFAEYTLIDDDNYVIYFRLEVGISGLDAGWIKATPTVLENVVNQQEISRLNNLLN